MASWGLGKHQATFDNRLGIVGDVILRVAIETRSFIGQITQRYGCKIYIKICKKYC